MVFNRYLKFWLLYNDLLVVLAIEQRRISKGSSPAPHQWRLPPPSPRVSCLAAWTQVLILMLVISCVFFFASMFVVEIFSHPITACDLIFSFPGLWLFFLDILIYESVVWLLGHKFFWVSDFLSCFACLFVCCLNIFTFDKVWMCRRIFILRNWWR